MRHITLSLCLLLAMAGFTQTQVSLPGGAREAVSAVGDVVRLSATGEVESWTDTAGNAQLASNGQDWTGKCYALEVLDAKTRTRVLPSDKATVRFPASGDGIGTVEISEPGGVTLHVRQGGNALSLAVTGPGAYILRGRNTCRQEGCRVTAPGVVRDASAGLGVVTGAPQILADATRTRALQLIAKNPITWTLTQTDGWAWIREGIAWETPVAPADTVQLASVPLPPRTGPVQVGLYARRNFRPSGGPVCVATLSDTRFELGIGVTLPAKPVGMKLYAALIPINDDDPVETSEQGVWFSRFDRYNEWMRHVDVTPGNDGNSYKLQPHEVIGEGLYRLRLWLTPDSIPLPETLGGPKGAVVGYFPGFTGRGNAISQAAPQGDVLVTVSYLRDDIPHIDLLSPSGRCTFWRGEKVLLRLHSHATKPVKGTLMLSTYNKGSEDEQLPPLMPLTLPAGGVIEIQLDTKFLGPSVYDAVFVGKEYPSSSFSFTIAPPREPGMVNIASPMHGPSDIAAFQKIGTNLWTDIMPSTDGHHPAWPSFPPLARNTAGMPSATMTDALTAGNWLLLQGIQSRQISFGLHYDTPEYVQETLRKELIYAQLNRRFPGALGTIFDYDLAGTGPGLNYAAPYINAGKRRQEWLSKQWEAAWAAAKAKGATDADKSRLQALFNANIIGGMYRDAEAGLHAAVPEGRHSSSVTADHNYIQAGQYFPTIYGPLDFRYLEVWNDQIYPDSAHDMQESFWTALLRMEKPAGQPIWITVPTAEQPGTHLRRSLEAFSHGANGTGYNAEGAAGLTGGWGCDPTHPDVRSAQETLTGALTTRYGAWINAFTPHEEVAILYSVSQGGTNFGLSSPIFTAFYTLAQLNRPARLLTEDEIAHGALSEVRALLVVGQTAKLPDATVKAMADFIAHGGKVLCDKNTKVELPGAVTLADVGWPGGLWPNSGNTFHGILKSFPATMGASLKAALGTVGVQPLVCDDGSALVASTRAGAATLVTVTNNRDYPFEQLFTPEQQQTSFFRSFKQYGGIFYKDVRVPSIVTLALRPDMHPAHIFDVFAGKELPVENGAVKVDLSTLSGRLLLLCDTLPTPTVSLAQKPGDPLVTLVAKSPVPLPVRLVVGGQTVFRAATAAGSCDTFVSGGNMQITNLLTGETQTVELPAVTVKAILHPLPAVQVWDIDRLRAVLKAKNLAIYVDARQPELYKPAQDLARVLHADVLFNPPVLDYPVTWDRTPEKQAAVDKIRTDGTLALRRDDEVNLQWTGALQPAFVLNRPVLLFGNAVNNRLIADLDSVTLLNRPARPENSGPGQAIIQSVAAPFWNGADAVVALCADAAGLRAALAKVQAIATGVAQPDALSTLDDGEARAERRRLLGLDPVVYPTTLTPLKLTPAASDEHRLTPATPVAALAETQGGVVAILHSPGFNLVKVNEGKTLWKAVTGGYYQPEALFVNAAGEIVTSDGTFVWRHAVDGKVLWKMLAAPLRAPEADGSTWVRVGDVLKQVSADAQIVKTITLPGALLALSTDLTTAYIQRPGKEGTIKSDSALVAVNLADGAEKWSVPNLNVTEAVVSADGSTVGCIENECMAGRDDLDRADASRLTAVDAATGRVRLRRPLGASMTHLRSSADGNTLTAISADLRRRITADVAEDVVTATDLNPGGLTTDVIAEGIRESGVTAVAARGTDGHYFGTLDGRITSDEPIRKLVAVPNLLDGLAMTDPAADLATLREAPLVDSPTLQPHTVPGTFSLVPEQTSSYCIRGDLVTIAGPNVVPLESAVRIPKDGKYRFTIIVGAPKEREKFIGVLRVGLLGKNEAQTQPRDGDRFAQTAVLTLPAGTHSIGLLFGAGWGDYWQDCWLKEMRVEAAD